MWTRTPEGRAEAMVTEFSGTLVPEVKTVLNNAFSRVAGLSSGHIRLEKVQVGNPYLWHVGNYQFRISYVRRCGTVLDFSQTVV